MNMKPPTMDNDYTEYETINNSGKFLIDRSGTADASRIIDRFTGKPDPLESYTVYSEPEKAYIDASPDQIKSFNSLKRHALMNQLLGNPRFQSGGLVKKLISKAKGGLKTPYHSAFAQRSTRRGVYSAHRVYPDANNPEAYVERRWWDEHPDKYYDYNPSGLDFNYDDYDYSNTVPVKGGIDYDYNDWKNVLLSEYDAAVKNGWIDKANPYETFNPGNTPAEEIKRRQQSNYQLYTPIVRADGSLGKNLFEKSWQGPEVFDNYTIK